MTINSLPLQFAHQRLRRMAEQFQHRSRVELVETLELLGMDAAGHEQAIDAEFARAGKVGAHGIPDREYLLAVDLVTLAFAGQRHRALVDRPVRLAVEEHFAAELA